MERALVTPLIQFMFVSVLGKLPRFCDQRALILCGLPIVLIALPCAVSGAAVSLSWSDNSDNEAGFHLERSVGGGAFEPLAVLGPNVSAYVDQDVVPTRDYLYRLRAFNDNGLSTWVTSNPVLIPDDTTDDDTSLVSETQDSVDVKETNDSNDIADGDGGPSTTEDNVETRQESAESSEDMEADEVQAPTCNDLTATIYVANGRIVGGPLDGNKYLGFLTGTPGSDVIVGTAGNDRIDGGRGDDVICGRDGNDSIAGDRGEDLLDGEGGDDILSGDQDDDRLYGGSGNDELYGDAGNDDLYGDSDTEPLNGAGTEEPGRYGASDRADGGKGSNRCTASVRRRCDGYAPMRKSSGRSSPVLKTSGRSSGGPKMRANTGK